MSLATLLARALVGAIDELPVSFPKSADTTYRVANTAQDGSTIFATVTQGSKGIESKIGSGGEVVFERNPDHIEDIDFRNILIFPTHGKYALLLTERIGTRGVASFLRKLLTDTLRENFHEVTTTIKALTTVADLETMDLRLRSLDFRFPANNDPNGRRLDMQRPAGEFSLRWKFREPSRLSNFTDESGAALDASRVFGAINPGLEAAGLHVTGDRLKELGVAADLHVTLPSGNKRSFTLGTDEGPALAYTLEPQTPVPGSSDGRSAEERVKPSNDDFLRVCKEAVSDVAGNFGIAQQTATFCRIPDPSIPVEIPQNWKVVWNVPDHLATGGA